LNEHLPEGQKLTDLEHILHVLDFDGSGNIELNEFFEVCRRFYTFLNETICSRVVICCMHRRSEFLMLKA
jgi:Ca2+-binding EF-hand superfamily protein